MGVDEAEKEKGRPEAGRGGSRRESSPLGWSELTEAQQEALRGLVRALGQMVREPRRPRRRSCGVLADSPIDTERRNRVLLVDGARGSGKTTVLVTLVEALCALLQDPSACAGGRERARPEGVDAGSWQALLEELDRELGGVACVPTGLLDFRPFPEDQPVVLAVLRALKPLVRALAGPSSEREEAGGGGGFVEPGCEPEGEALWRRWDEVARAAAVGWGRRTLGSPPGDAMARELEVREVDEARTSLPGRLAALLEALEEVYRRRHGVRPLFVVPVDDPDVAPQRGPELLDAMRLLHHRSLVFVAAADRGLLQATLATATYQDLASGGAGVRSGIPPEAQARLLGEEPAALASRLAVEHLEKVVPSEHTFPLKPLAPRERVALLERAGLEKPAWWPADDEAARRSLGEVLPPWPRWLQALAGRLGRRWQELGEAADGPAGEQTLWWEAWRIALDREQPAGRLGEVLRRGVRWDADYGRLHLDLDELRFYVLSRLTRQVERDGWVVRARLRSEVRLGLPLQEGEERTGPFGEVLPGGAGQWLPEDLARLLLWALGRPGWFAELEQAMPRAADDGSPVAVSHETLRLQKIDLEEISRVGPRVTPFIEPIFSWPTPRWPDADYLKAFLDHFERGVRNMEKELRPRSHEEHVLTWLAAFVSAVARALGQDDPLAGGKPRGEDLLDWIRDRICQVFRKVTREMGGETQPDAAPSEVTRPVEATQAWRAWVESTLPLLFAPEHGLPEDVARRILSTLLERTGHAMRKQWERDRIGQLQAHVFVHGIQFLGRGRIEGLKRDLLERSPNHPWHFGVEPEWTYRQRVVRVLREVQPNLDRTFDTPAKLACLLRMELKERQAFVEAVEQFRPDGIGFVPYAGMLVDLWERFGGANDESDGFRIEDGEVLRMLRPHLYLVAEGDEVPDGGFLLAEAQEADAASLVVQLPDASGAGVAVELRRVWLATDLPAASALIYLLACDLAVWRWQERSAPGVPTWRLSEHVGSPFVESDASSVSFPGVRVPSASPSSPAWPAPAVPSAVFWDAVLQQWNEKVTDLAKLAERRGRMPRQDTLAVSLAELVAQWILAFDRDRLLVPLDEALSRFRWGAMDHLDRADVDRLLYCSDQVKQLAELPGLIEADRRRLRAFAERLREREARGGKP